MTRGTVTTGVYSQFTATHLGMEGRPHWHTWHVEAEWLLPLGTDGREYKARLDAMLAAWDGGALSPEVQLNEEIALAIGEALGCCAVRVSRPADGLFARWTA